MPIQVNLKELMVQREISETQLARETGRAKANVSKIKNNRSKQIRFSTLEALCRALNCQPKDILKYCRTPNNDE